MNPQNHTSFIPKKPVISYASASGKSGSHTDFLLVVSIIIFLISVVAYFGIWGMNYTQENVLDNKKIDIANAQSRQGRFVYEDNAEIVRRVEAFNSVFNKHLVISPLFTFLEQSTSKKIAFTSLEYKYADNNASTLVVTGYATDYAAIAEQSNFYNASNTVLINPVFSKFTDNQDKTIGFNLDANVRSEILLFNKISPNNLGINFSSVSTLNTSSNNSNVAQTVEPVVNTDNNDSSVANPDGDSSVTINGQSDPAPAETTTSTNDNSTI